MVKSRQSPKNNDSSSFLAATLVAVSALIIAVSMSDSDGPQILSTSTTASSVSSVDDLKVSNKNKDQEEKRGNAKKYESLFLKQVLEKDSEERRKNDKYKENRKLLVAK